jgi:hypothetical protein
MKYFAKYLPVEGEIKKGDYYRSHAIDAEGIYKAGEDDKYGNGNKLPTQASEGRYKTKVKLFLCSRDIIKVGDLYFNKDYNYFKTCFEIPNDAVCGNIIYFDDTSLFDYVKDCIKVIGEISPEAVWIKEGDEFEEYEDWWFSLHNNTFFIKKHEDDFRNLISTDWPFVQRIKVKCPTCNTFH